MLLTLKSAHFLRRALSFFVIGSLITSVAQPGALSAFSIPEPDKISNRQKAHFGIAFTDEGGSLMCSETPGNNLNGKDNIEKTWNFFIGKGLTAVQAAGAMGNIGAESRFNPLIAQDGPETDNPSQFGSDIGVGKAWGLIQWDAGGRAVGYAEKAGITTPIGELSTQLELVWWHMTVESPTSYSNMHREYKNITDVVAATEFFERTIEGAGTPRMDHRIELANEYLRAYGGGSDSSNSSNTTPTASAASCGDNDDGGGVATADGFTFPLKTTKTVIKGGSSNDSGHLVWCITAQSSCHHSYKAADIMVPTGVTVIAAKPGVVQNVNSGNQHPNNVTIKTDDGKGINYYTHLGANTVTLRNGQKVSAGDELGKIGTTEDAMRTAPHLHFDMLPSRYKFRPSCSGSSCGDLPFIDPQAALAETYKLLPEN